MDVFFLRLACNLACAVAFFLPSCGTAQAVQLRAAPDNAQNTRQTSSSSSHAALVRQRAQSFVLPRLASAGIPGGTAAARRLLGMGQRLAMPRLASSNQPWQPVGPSHIQTQQFGAVTGRITSIAIAPWDASGNTVYLGSTGGGVWRSSNAAASDATTVTFEPLTDDPAAFSGINITSLSMGAVSVQPGSASTNGVVLAGTGDPNDALDSYYGAGILRSTDGGTTWSLITESSDGFSGGIANYSFVGNAFSGFAWSTANTSLVVGAVTDSYDGFINNINNSGTSNVAEAGLYYSNDAGQTWFLSTIEDGPNQVIESSQTTVPSTFPGVPVTAVVWNPIRKMFYAAVQYHGYYQSPDGVTWTRLANQPGTSLTTTNCPADPGYPGSNSCAIFRGVLAVQPVTGDMFALTVDANNVDQGLWQDVCNAGTSGTCANATVTFGVQIGDTALDSASGNGTIPDGTYDLALAATPNGTDTLLFAGTQDIFRCSLTAGCVWRNTTNSGTCNSGQVAPAQHAIAALGAPAGQTLPLVYFGNDGGLWRSTDGVDQTGPACSSTDASYFQNLNLGLGSLGEITGLASNPTDANALLAGFGVNGSAGTASSAFAAWDQLLAGEGGGTAIDPVNSNNWYATLGPYVAIGQCVQGTSCTAADFGSQPAIGAVQTSGDQALLYAPYRLDPQDSANLILGTCRVWRGPASGGSAWSGANAISPMLDGHNQPSCNGNALIRSLAAGGPEAQSSSGSQNTGSQVLYAGMAGLLDGGGGSVGGHVFSTPNASQASGTTPWTDLALSPVANEQSYNGVFNPYHYDVSALFADPHDATGNTVYATVQGFGAPHLYLSTNGGANWTNITKNLPDLPLNDVMVDPNDASVVYVASDGGVFVTQNVADCMLSTGQCWNVLGTGLPLAPAVALAQTTAGGGYLRVGTYGRGIWQTPLLSSLPQTTMTLTPTSLTFSGQPVQTASPAQTVTVSNTGSNALMVGTITVSGDFAETDTCSGSIAAGGSCQIQVTFTPSTTGALNGTLTVPANISGGQETVSLTGTGTTQSAIVLLPTSVDFGGQTINTTSSPQQVTISNTSSSPVAMTSESVTGPFAIQTNTCSSSLAANTGCTLAIVFAPTQTGSASGVLTVATAQGTQTVSLSGTGENPPTDTLSPLSLSFPPTLENTASAPQTVTLTNSGGSPLTGIMVQTTGDFTVTNGCGYSLNAQSSCTLTVEYTPHATGAETGSITVTDALRSQTVSLSGTGIAPPTDTLSTNALLFPATVVGQSATPQTVTLTNSGDAPLTQVAVQIAGAGFGESNTCGSAVPAHSSCSITVTFQPVAAGNATGQLDVSDAIRTQVVALSGSGETAAEDNVSPLSLAFAGQTVGTTSGAQTVVLSNNGQATLTGVRFQGNNPDFPFTTNCGSTLQPGASCDTQVSFVPHTAGAESGLLSVIDVNRTQNIALTGAGLLPNITLAPASIDFGVIGVQTLSPSQTLTLTNGSASTVNGIQAVATGPFLDTSTCGVTLPPGQACTFSLVFEPVATGAQSGSLTVSSANAATLTATLAGTAIGFELVPTSATTVSVTSGGIASYALQLVPLAGSVGNVSLSCGNLPPNSTCSLTPTAASLGAPTAIAVAVETGVQSVAQIRRAGLGDAEDWPCSVLLLALPLLLVGWRRKALWTGSSRWTVLLALAAVGLAGTMTGCGKGGGPLAFATSSSPLPSTSLTPSGTYTVTVTAQAGGLQKSVSLTVQVQ